MQFLKNQCNETIFPTQKTPINFGVNYRFLFSNQNINTYLIMNEIAIYCAFLLIVILGLAKWIIDLLELIKELRIKITRLNYAHNFDAKEYLQLQEEFSEALDENKKLRDLINSQEEIINDLSKTD